MEDLTKHQLILLALLVSFVTSLATGIVTVALMERAPPTVTQTINRVVERTVEKVVPSGNQAAVVTKETVVVKEGDQVIRAVEENAPSIVRIRKIEGVGANRAERFVGIGAVVSKRGLIVSDEALLAKSFNEAGSPIPHSFIGIDHAGNILALRVIGTDDSRDLVVFEARPAEEGKETPTFTPLDLRAGSELKLGQSVIALGGEERDTVGAGIVSAIVPGPLALIKTDDAAASGILGTLLLNLSGDLVGLKVGPEAFEKHSYLSSSLIDESVEKITTAAGVRRE